MGIFKKHKKVLAIPDLHFPFHKEESFQFLKSVYKEYNCNKVVCLGDEIDAHALSRWPHDPDGMSAGDEFKQAMFYMERLYDLFPDVDLCMSNHTARPWKKSFESGIPKAFLKSYHEAMMAPKGWSVQEKHVIDNVLYIHGTQFTGQQAHVKACQKFRMSTVLGHIHAHGGVQYFDNGLGNKIFGLNAGCLIGEGYAFKYAKEYPDQPTLGCGVIYGPNEAYFVPFK